MRTKNQEPGTKDFADHQYMERALFLASRGRGRTTPNPMVGAVVVSPAGIILGQGYHERAGTPHAEIHALAAAGSQARGSTLYCTLEPCCHVGRTGPCVQRIVDAGIRRVVAAVEDPNPLVRGQGFAFLRAHGIDVDIGVGADSAARLNQPFFTVIRERRPFVILKAATSLDARIAVAPGQRTRLTSAAADRHAQRFRAEVDAIGVGSGTVLADDPTLTARVAYRERPLTRVVFDRRLRTPASAALLSTRDAGPVMIMTTAEAADQAGLREPLEAAGAEVIAGDGTLTDALQTLAVRGIGSLLLEGGAAVHAAAWDAGLVDFVRLYIAPRIIGSDGVPLVSGRAMSLSGLFDARVEPVGSDVLIEGYVHRPH